MFWKDTENRSSIKRGRICYAVPELLISLPLFVYDVPSPGLNLNLSETTRCFVKIKCSPHLGMHSTHIQTDFALGVSLSQSWVLKGIGKVKGQLRRQGFHASRRLFL